MPPDHPLRQRLNDEVHARPPEKVTSPCRVSFLALVADGEQRRAAWEIIRGEAARCGAPPPNPASAHYSANFDGFRLKVERHAEFYRIKIIVSGYGRGGPADGFAETALDSGRAAWVETLPGQILCAIHVVIGPSDDWPPNFDRLGPTFPTTDGLIGAMLVGGAGAAFTDLRIREDRFSRLLIYDHGLSPGQIGRTLQRLVEMDTYRMLALMALPNSTRCIRASTCAHRRRQVGGFRRSRDRRCNGRGRSAAPSQRQDSPRPRTRGVSQ